MLTAFPTRRILSRLVPFNYQKETEPNDQTEPHQSLAPVNRGLALIRETRKEA